jgi:hypothetical protein
MGAIMAKWQLCWLAGAGRTYQKSLDTQGFLLSWVKTVAIFRLECRKRLKKQAHF